MPTVTQINGKTVAQVTVTVPTTNPNLITQMELAEASIAMNELALLVAKAKPLTKMVDTFNARVLELATGKAEDDYKFLTNNELAEIINLRIVAGELKIEPGVMDFTVKDNKAQRSVSWKEAYIKVTSEAQALALLNGTKEQHSYKVVPFEKETAAK